MSYDPKETKLELWGRSDGKYLSIKVISKMQNLIKHYFYLSYFSPKSHYAHYVKDRRHVKTEGNVIHLKS